MVLGGKPETLAAPPPPAASMPGGGPAGVLAAADGGAAPPGIGSDGPYTVESGDTLGQIALKTLGSSRRAADLAKFNGIPVDSPLKVGQELRIPPAAPASAPAPAPAGSPQAQPPAQAKASAPPDPAAPAKDGKRTHTVGKGDTLFALAKRYYGDGGRFRGLAEANGLDPDEPLKVGTELKVP